MRMLGSHNANDAVGGCRGILGNVRLAGALPLALALMLVPFLAAGSLALAAGDGEMVGVPWTGDAGVSETTAQIMTRALMAPQQNVLEAEDETRPHLRPYVPAVNPLAPLTPAIPFDQGSAFAEEVQAPQTIGTNFLTEQLGIDSGFIPPDTMGDVGPSQILTVTNGRIKVQDKSGVVGALNSDLDVFFNSVRNGSATSDPHVRYDRLTGRWFVNCINVTTPPAGIANRVLIAVSDNATITGGTVWTFYFFKIDTVGTTPNTDTNGFLDYPTLDLCNV